MSVPRFWREIPQRYNLVGTRCKNCSAAYFPPRSVCPQCRRESLGKLEPLAMQGKGTVVSHTVVHEAFGEFALQTPYALAIVRLDEGPMVTAQVVDVDPAAVKAGMRVEATFRRISQDGEAGVIHYGYKFRPAGRD